MYEFDPNPFACRAILKAEAVLDAVIPTDPPHSCPERNGNAVSSGRGLHLGLAVQDVPLQYIERSYCICTSCEIALGKRET